MSREFDIEISIGEKLKKLPKNATSDMLALQRSLFCALCTRKDFGGLCDDGQRAQNNRVLKLYCNAAKVFQTLNNRSDDFQGTMNAQGFKEKYAEYDF